MGTPRICACCQKAIATPEQKSRGGRTAASQTAWCLHCGQRHGRCRTAALCPSVGPRSVPSRGSALVRTRRPFLPSCEGPPQVLIRLSPTSSRVFCHVCSSPPYHLLRQPLLAARRRAATGCLAWL
eukprot:129296-Prymnesium_polylepis.1